MANTLPIPESILRVDLKPELADRLLKFLRSSPLGETQLAKMSDICKALPELNTILPTEQRLTLEMAALAELAGREGCQQVALYGASSAGRNFLESARRRGIHVKTIFDGNPDLHGVLEGIQVLAPESLREEPCHNLVIAALGSREEILKQLEREGLITGKSVYAVPPVGFPWNELPEWHSLPMLVKAKGAMEAFIEEALDSGVHSSAVFMALGYPGTLGWFLTPAGNAATRALSPFVYTMQ